MSTSALAVLRCPYCEGELSTGDDDRLGCRGCHKRFPNVGTIPVLTRDPEKWVANWRYRLADFVEDNEHARDNILAQLATSEPLELTRQRMERLRERLLEHRERIAALTSRAGLEPETRQADELAPVPGEGSITAYYHQIHRDWGWQEEGNREVEEALAEVEAVLEWGASLGVTLVLGAGAGRLAYELHRRHDATLTLALDLNPLPFVVANTLMSGEPLDLFEFPIRPPTLDQVAVSRRLPSRDRPEGFHLLFADGLAPPVRAGAIDTVITPWFIDQVPQDLATLLPTLRALLAEGGRWVNHGPLVYHPGHTKLVHRYGEDELLALCEQAGLRIEAQQTTRMSYMQSPVGSQGRTERVLSFRAAAVEGTTVPNAPDPVDWRNDPDVPVPRFDGLDAYRAPHPMFAAIAQLVDGERTTRQIAQLMTTRHGLPADAALEGVAAALVEIARGAT